MKTSLQIVVPRDEDHDAQADIEIEILKQKITELQHEVTQERISFNYYAKKAAQLESFLAHTQMISSPSASPTPQ